jgi:hypothetical protein
MMSQTRNRLPNEEKKEKERDTTTDKGKQKQKYRQSITYIRSY